MPTFSWGGGAWGAGSWGAGSPSAPQPNSRPAGATGNACTLLRDLSTGDLALPIRLVRGPAAIAQQHWEALNFFAGEWFADLRQGMPFYQVVAGRQGSISLINSMYRKALLLVRGTVSIDRMESVLEREARILRTTYSATLDDGTILTTADQPYIVSGNINGNSF
jgi:hypothetical protein